MTQVEKREQRIKILEILYAQDLCEEFSETTIEEPYVNEVVNKFVSNQNTIDELISTSLVNYRLQRLSYVDRAIIRMATAEMLLGLDRRIAINEAIEIAKVYSDSGDGASFRFVNKVLDTISKKIN